MSDNLPPLKPDLEGHEYEMWGQNMRGDFVTVEKAKAYARAALEAIRAAVPAGYVLVPKELTAEMRSAAKPCTTVSQLWESILAASPQPQPLKHAREQRIALNSARLAPVTGCTVINSAAYIELYEAASPKPKD